MASSISSAKACAQTMLFQNLAINSFTGAIPHVVLVVDKHPSVLQKVLVEGYLRAMEQYNSHCSLPNSSAMSQLSQCQISTHHRDMLIANSSKLMNNSINNYNCKDDKLYLQTGYFDNEFTRVLKSVDRAANGELFIPLDANICTPCGSLGLLQPSLEQKHNCTNERSLCKHCRMTCSILPFDASTFLDEMRRLQRFLRLCGQKSPQNNNERTSQSIRECYVESENVNNVCSSSDTTDYVTNVTHINAEGAATLQEKNSSNDTNMAAHECIYEANKMHESFFRDEFKHLTYLLKPLSSLSNKDDDSWETSDDATLQLLHNSLQTGPLRQLLGFILIQQSAFQNEMKKYRLRLTLFDMGMRVAEHCHLQSMSAHADALAMQKNYKNALEDDQIYTYGRSCSLQPRKIQVLARAIADAIDVFA